MILMPVHLNSNSHKSEKLISFAMVLKIEKPEGSAAPEIEPSNDVAVDAAEEGSGGSNSESFDPPPSKKQKKQSPPDEAAVKQEPGEVPQAPPLQANDQTQAPPLASQCAGCAISDADAPGSLLLFDDPEEDEKEKSADEKEKR
jgi:hypothetical protein